MKNITKKKASPEEFDFPEDLKEMSLAELDMLAVQIRDFLIRHISKTGGHLASNLGVVELAIALHKSFDAPEDKIIWDVGHQAYVHKILTGRADKFDTLRQLDGISGFPNRRESKYDPFTTGHSSNSVSLVRGLAAARDMQGKNYNTVAVIGDGALTGGLAYEGLNDLGSANTNAIIIINDNGMSIGRNTGGMSRHLGKLRVSEGYHRFKKNLKRASKKLPGGETIVHGLEHMRDSLKYILVDGVIFEELGYTYLGPVDGHNIESLLENLELAKAAKGPVVLHVKTKKGKGYRNAEKHPESFHGAKPFDVLTGMPLERALDKTFSEVFGAKLAEMTKNDDRIVALTAAMQDGTGLRNYPNLCPGHLYDVGIAEAHAATCAGGMAEGGLRPFVAVYSTFLQRAYDEVLIDVCLQKLPVVFCVDRAGVVGSDGETHHGIFDMSYLSHMPNMTVLAPADGKELEEMMDYAHKLEMPCAIRYPRGSAKDVIQEEHRTPIKDGACPLDTHLSCDVHIWAVGAMVSIATKAAELLRKEGRTVSVTNARFVQPIDQEKLIADNAKCKLLVTAEDNVLRGGFGEHVAAILDANAVSEGEPTKVNLLTLGWPDCFIEHGSISQLQDRYGLSPEKMAERIREALER